jgi:hypothetical protein
LFGIAHAIASKKWLAVALGALGFAFGFYLAWTVLPVEEIKNGTAAANGFDIVKWLAGAEFLSEVGAKFGLWAAE